MRALLLLLCLVFAGCLGSSGPYDAQAGHATAVKEAMSWDPTARLLAVAGAEGESPFASGWASRMGGPDADPQDGRAPNWLYVFLGRAPEPLFVIVAGDEVQFAQVVTEEESLIGDVVHLGRVPLEPADLDSVAAAQVAAGKLEGPAFWNVVRGLEDDDLDGEGQDETDDTMDARDTAMWLVYSDAAPLAIQNGMIVPFPTFDEAHGGTFDGTLGVGGSADHGFDVDDMDDLSVTLTLDPAMPLDLVRLTLTAPDGTEHGAVLDAGPTGNAEPVSVRVERPMEGDWSVTVTAERGARVAYVVEWS